MTFAALRQLLRVLNDAVDTLEEELKPQGLDFPPLDAPYDPASPVEAALSSEAAMKATELIVAAASQLCAAVRPPGITILETTLLFYLPAVMQFINRIHVVELLRDAGPSGIHVRDIASQADVDDLKLGHCLRLCATFHIFKEVLPDVFANNRVSSILDTGKPYADVISDPKPNAKYKDTNGLAAYIELQTGLILPVVSQIPAHFAGTRANISRDPTRSLLSTMHGYEGDTLFVFLESQKNAQMRETLAVAMQVSTIWEHSDSIVEGYDWASIAPGGLVVDVGGGIGHIMRPLYERFEGLSLEVQDLPGRCEQGSKIWDSKCPGAIRTGRIQFRAHNFFDPQPVKGAAVFLVRNVVHNWPDDRLETLLRHLRDAAEATTRLLIADHVISHTCTVPPTHDGVHGGGPRDVPEPLLQNLGRASAYVHLMDICMLSFANAHERTLDEHIAVAARAGWRIVEVCRVRENLRFAHMTFAPA